MQCDARYAIRMSVNRCRSAYLSPSRLRLKAFSSFVTMAISSWSSGINSMAGTVRPKLFFKNIRELGVELGVGRARMGKWQR